jgi:hypothetical protein
MSTIPLLPPDRSHICIAPASVVRAQSLAGSGVGTAATLGDAAVDGGADAEAGAVVGGAADGAADGAGVAAPVQAPAIRMATIARAGTLR